MKKKLSIFISMVIISMLFTPAIFARGEGQRGRNSSASGGPKEVTIYHVTSVIREEYMASIFDDFKKEQGVNVRIISGGLSDMYSQNLAVALNGGEKLDVLWINGQDCRSYASRGIIADITNLVTYWDRFYDSSLSLFTFGGKRYGVPMTVGATSGVFYNNDILKNYGLQAPITYDDLIKMRDVLANDRISVFSMGGGDKYMWPMWYFCAFNQTSGNKAVERTEAVLRGQAKWTDKDFVDAMAVLERMGKDNLFQTGFNGMDGNTSVALFSSGRAACFFTGDWGLNTFRESGFGYDKLGIVHFPIVVPNVKPESTGSAGGDPLALVNNIPADRQDLALQLMNYLSDLPRINIVSESRGVGIYPNKSYKPPANADPLVVNTIAKDLIPQTVVFLDWIWPPAVVTAFQDQIQAVTGGQTTAAAAMVEIQKVFDALVRDGYKFD